MSFTSDQRSGSSYAPPTSSASPDFTNSGSSTPEEGSSLRADLDALKTQLADFIAKAGSETMKTARQTTTDVANQVGGKAADVANQVGSKAADVASQEGSKASDLASAASEQAKTFASELERFGRSNPLGAIAGALLVGVVIGLIGRRH